MKTVCGIPRAQKTKFSRFSQKIEHIEYRVNGAVETAVNREINKQLGNPPKCPSQLPPGRPMPPAEPHPELYPGYKREPVWHFGWSEYIKGAIGFIAEVGLIILLSKLIFVLDYDPKHTPIIEAIIAFVISVPIISILPYAMMFPFIEYFKDKMSAKKNRAEIRKMCQIDYQKKLEKYQIDSKEYDKKFELYKDKQQRYLREKKEYECNSERIRKEVTEETTKKYNAEYKAKNEEIDRKNEEIENNNKIIERNNELIEKESEDIAKRAQEDFDKCISEIDTFFPEKYYDHIDDIIELIEDGRADSVKEAINLYEQEKIEKERLYTEQRRLSVAERRAEEEEEFRIEEMERQERIEREEREERQRIEKARLRVEEENLRIAEKRAKEEERLRQEEKYRLAREEDEKRRIERQCSNCKRRFYCNSRKLYCFDKDVE